MATFVVLSKLTDQGARNIQSLRKGVEENMARGERLGIKIHGWYLTQGRYDIVVLAEAPDAETMLAQAAAIAGVGNTRTETLRAFTLDEVEQVLTKGSSA
ncbi:MAG: GYD domain-containing protein [Chloroflexota bacterium]